MQVTVLHAVDRLMERQLDAQAAALLARRLAGQGIATLLPANTTAIEGDGRVQSVRLASGKIIPADLVVMAVGIRPETALARKAGLTVERAIVVDDHLRSSDLDIYAIGECAQHRGACIGLVAPALAHAEIAARCIAGEAASYIAEADATALKVAGAGVWSAGDIEAATAEPIIYHDPDGGEYRKFLLRDGRLVGAMLYGETGEAAWYHRLIASGAIVAPLRNALVFGEAYAPNTSFLEAAE
jgi:nitrite reductase (NADH) large subunit